MIVERTQLIDGLAKAKTARGRSSINVLQGALLDVNGPRAHIKATDMETFLQVSMVPEESVSWVKALVDIDRALLLLKAMKVKLLWIEQTAEGHVMVVDAANVEKGKIHELPRLDHPLEDYVSWPEPKGETKTAFSILPAELIRCHAAVKLAISKDESRPVLAAMAAIVNGNLTFAATDSYRLHLQDVDADPLMDGTMLIPRKAIDLVCKHAKGGTKRILFEQSGNHYIRVCFGDTGDEWFIRGTEGTFPDVSKLMPGTSHDDVVATVDREQLLAVVKQVSVVLENKLNPLVLRIHKGTVQVSDQNGKASDDVDASVTGAFQGEPWGVNSEFLQYTLRSITTERVVIRYKAALRPFLVLGETLDSPRVLMMPIRLAMVATPEQKKPTAKEVTKQAVDKAIANGAEVVTEKRAPAKDDPRPHFFNLADRYLAGLDGDRRKYGAAYVSFMIGDRKTAPKRADVPPRQAFNTRGKLRALAQQAGYEPVRGVADHEDTVR